MLGAVLAYGRHKRLEVGIAKLSQVPRFSPTPPNAALFAMPCTRLSTEDLGC